MCSDLACNPASDLRSLHNFKATQQTNSHTAAYAHPFTHMRTPETLSHVLQLEHISKRLSHHARLMRSVWRSRSPIMHLGMPRTLSFKDETVSLSLTLNFYCVWCTSSQQREDKSRAAIALWERNSALMPRPVGELVQLTYIHIYENQTCIYIREWDREVADRTRELSCCSIG